MKIYEFLLETNVMISHGEIYAGKELSEKIKIVVERKDVVYKFNPNVEIM